MSVSDFLAPCLDSYTVPSFVSEPHAKTRILDPSEFISALKAIKLWKSLYRQVQSKVLPEHLSYQASNDGLGIATRMQFSLISSLSSHRIVAVGEYEGNIQSLAIVSIEERDDERRTIVLEDLLVAPWNNALCRHYLSKQDSVLLEKLMEKVHKAGTTMLYFLREKAKEYGANKMTLVANPLARGFYSKIGMTPISGERGEFEWDLLE